MSFLSKGFGAALIAASIALATSAFAASPADDAKQIMSDRCAACHGNTGSGDGPSAEYLNPKPPNFHDKKWQASITDEEIAKAIVHGGPSIGKSVGMAPNEDLENQPKVVKALVQIIRGKAKWPESP